VSPVTTTWVRGSAATAWAAGERGGDALRSGRGGAASVAMARGAVRGRSENHHRSAGWIRSRLAAREGQARLQVLIFGRGGLGGGLHQAQLFAHRRQLSGDLRGGGALRGQLVLAGLECRRAVTGGLGGGGELGDRSGPRVVRISLGGLGAVELALLDREGMQGLVQFFGGLGEFLFAWPRVRRGGGSGFGELLAGLVELALQAGQGCLGGGRRRPDRFGLLLEGGTLGGLVAAAP